MKHDKWLIIFAISLISLLALTFYFFSPLLDGIVMGIVFAYVAKPFKKRLERIGRIPSAILATLIIIIPISILMFYGIFQGVNQAVYIITHQKLYEEKLIEVLRETGIEKEYIMQIKGIFPSLLSIIQSALRISALDVTVKAIMFLMNFLISAIVCFYALLDSENFMKRTMKILPEERRDGFEKFVEELDETFLGLWFGNFVVAMLIGLASIPFFLYFRIPFAPLLSGLMFLAALIPIFAEWMILVPVFLYLAIQNISTAIWFIVIGFTFLYFLPEIILRPYFVGYTSKIHPLVLMLSFIGGAVVGGVSGFFIAPMVTGLITTVYNYYTQ